jgi:glycosyltransferase involved in cell wall biosynthesis
VNGCEGTEISTTVEDRARALSAGKRVAVVHDWIFGRRGGERVLEAILALFPDADVYALFGAPEPARVLRLAQGARHVFRYSFLQGVPLIGRVYKHLLPLLPVAAESFDLSGYDLVVSSSHCVAKGVVPPPQARHVCYLHSPMRYAWDQEHRYFPRAPSLTRPVELLRRLILSRLRVWDVASSARVDALVANSAFVARRARLYYGRESSVVHPNVGVERFEGLARTPSDFESRRVLLFGAWVPYKRMRDALSWLVEAGIPVVAAGQGSDLNAARADFAGRPGVEFVVEPTDAQVEALYARCHALLFPAIEDFGIVPLEAMAAGLWVVAPDVGGTAETVVPGVTGFPFREGSREALLGAVRRALATPSNEDTRAAALAHARKFGTARFQSEFLDIVEKVLA